MTVGINGVSDVIKKSLLTTIGDIIAASAVSTPARIAAPASGQVLTGQGAGVLPVWAAGGAVTLLKANSGTNTGSGATNVDTYDVSGLTAKDSLLFIMYGSSLTQQTAGQIGLYHVTDGTYGPTLNSGGALLAAKSAFARILMTQTQPAATYYVWETSRTNTDFNTGGQTTTGLVEFGTNGIFTAWTGAWTIAFQHGGVTAGGTFRWSWAIYKIAGQ